MSLQINLQIFSKSTKERKGFFVSPRTFLLTETWLGRSQEQDCFPKQPPLPSCLKLSNRGANSWNSKMPKRGGGGNSTCMWIVARLQYTMGTLQSASLFSLCLRPHGLMDSVASNCGSFYLPHRLKSSEENHSNKQNKRQLSVELITRIRLQLSPCGCLASFTSKCFQISAIIQTQRGRERNIDPSN